MMNANELPEGLANLIADISQQIGAAQEQALEQQKRQMANAVFDAVFNGADPKRVGYFSAAPTTVVWFSRGNFVEIAIAQLGHEDTFDIETGVKVAVEHMLQGAFILIPCDASVPGFDAESVAKRLFNTTILNGNLLYDQSLLQATRKKFNVEMARRGAEQNNG